MDPAEQPGDLSYDLRFPRLFNGIEHAVDKVGDQVIGLVIIKENIRRDIPIPTTSNMTSISFLYLKPRYSFYFPFRLRTYVLPSATTLKVLFEEPPGATVCRRSGITN